MFFLSKDDFPTLEKTPDEKHFVSISNTKCRGEKTLLVPCKEVKVRERRKKVIWSKIDWLIGRTTRADGRGGTKAETEAAIQLPTEVFFNNI